MKARNTLAIAGLLTLALSARANAQTPSVKESALGLLRPKLTHYDLSPQGTLTVLHELGQQASAHAGHPEGVESAFLRAAAAADLVFLADYLGDGQLADRVAEELGVAPQALRGELRRELEASAQGVYRKPAQIALAALTPPEKPEEPPAAPGNVQRDALFVRAAAALVGDESVGARFAALARDPCAQAEQPCPAPYASLAPEGRRALVYLRELSTAAARLESARQLGDALAEALSGVTSKYIDRVRALVLRLPPRLPDDLPVQFPAQASGWPAPDLVVFVRSGELRYARALSARAAAGGEIELIAASGSNYPEMAALRYTPSKLSATRSIDELVEAIRALTKGSAGSRATLVVEPGTPSQLVACALVSLRKAGLSQALLIGPAQDGARLGVPLRVVLPDRDPPSATPDLKLRVRLGGYSLDAGRGTKDIPRVRDESGFHFDVAALRSAIATRAPRSAAVSFMLDVPTEQVLLALFSATPAHAPVDLLIR